MKFAKSMIVGAALVCAAVSPANAATLIGNTVHAVYLFPTVGTTFEDLGDAVVGASTPTYPNILGSGVLNVNFTASQIVFSWYGSQTAEGGSFNGMEFTDLTTPFTSAVMDSVSNTPGVVVSFAGGDVFVNLSGVTYRSGENITIDVDTAPAAVPEPASWGMMLSGLALIGFAMRRRATVHVSHA